MTEKIFLVIGKNFTDGRIIMSNLPYSKESIDIIIQKLKTLKKEELND